MKKILLCLALVQWICMNTFAQATSLTVDNQTPGWLSSKINYGDQQTLENLKVTGYINGTDIQFIYDLNSQRALTGVIDLEDVSIISGGTLYTNGYPRTINKDNVMPSSFFYDQKNHIRKFIYPKTLVEEPSIPFQKEGLVDSLIWTSTNVKSLNVSNGIGYASFIYIPEGIETISQIPNNIRIVFPSTIQNVHNYGLNNNLTIYSFIESPEIVYAKHENYYSDSYGGHRSYWAAIANSTIYIPKGKIEKYLESDFGTMKAYYEVNGNLIGKDNGNTFIEYYDIESTVVNAPNVIYKGETLPIDVDIYPDTNLVDRIDFKSSNSEIVGVNSSGIIEAKDYGQAEVYATPHLFIDGLETKTGSCLVKVIAHTEGIEMVSSLPIHIDEEKRLEAFTLPLKYSDNKITFSSSDSSIAEVNEEGVVKGVKKGTCTITAITVDGGYTAECVVTVLQPVESVTLEKHNLSMKVGDTESLYAQVSPSNADNKKILWYSSEEQSATVSANGEVEALKPGIVWIKAISEDNAQAKDSCLITIIQPVTGVTLSHDSYIFDKAGETIQLEATVLPNDASNKSVNWSSTNSQVCIVTNGLVTAIGAGTASVTVSTLDGNFSASCLIKVVQHAAKVELNKSATSLKVGETERLAATVLPNDAENKTLSWSSTNEQIATVDANGNVKAMKAGEAWIKAVSEDNAQAKDSCKVTVIQPVTGVTLSQNSYRLTNIGENIQLEATVQPEDASNKEVKWSSSNESVCIVANGKVVATGFGTAVVMAVTADGGFMATCAIVVKKETIPVTDVTLSQTQALLIEGETLQLTATVNPNDATNKNLIWKSSDETICVVTQAGLLIAMAEGEAIVTVIPENGVGQAQCNVTVISKENAAIEDVDGDAKSSIPVYDMMGCKVTHLVKGRLYIRNGRKFIAK